VVTGEFLNETCCMYRLSEPARLSTTKAFQERGDTHVSRPKTLFACLSDLTCRTGPDALGSMRYSRRHLSVRPRTLLQSGAPSTMRRVSTAIGYIRDIMRRTHALLRPPYADNLVDSYSAKSPPITAPGNMVHCLRTRYPNIARLKCREIGWLIFQNNKLNVMCLHTRFQLIAYHDTSCGKGCVRSGGRWSLRRGYLVFFLPFVKLRHVNLFPRSTALDQR
jgi:hypothetical protein